MIEAAAPAGTITQAFSLLPPASEVGAALRSRRRPTPRHNPPVVATARKQRGYIRSSSAVPGGALWPSSSDGGRSAWPNLSLLTRNLAVRDRARDLGFRESLVVAEYDHGALPPRQLADQP